MISKLTISLGFAGMVLSWNGIWNTPHAHGKEESSKTTATQEAKLRIIKASKNGAPIPAARVVKLLDILAVKGLRVAALAQEKKSGDFPSQDLFFTIYSRDASQNIDLAFDLGPIHCLHEVKTIDNGLYQLQVTAPGSNGKPVTQEIEVDAAAGTFIPMSDVKCAKFPCPAAQKFAASATIQVRTSNTQAQAKACAHP